MENPNTRARHAVAQPATRRGARARSTVLAFGLATAFGLAAAFAPAHAHEVSRVPDTIEQRVTACTPCHGKEGRAVGKAYFPRIAGKPAGYLFNQLANFRDGMRQFPAMVHLVRHLSDDYMREIATYFSAIDLPYPPPRISDAPPSVLARGEALVMKGEPARDIPACAACHGERLTGVVPAIPGLLGLPRDYVNAQIGSWKSGIRRAASPDCMAHVAKALTPDDISAISTWIGSQPVPPDSHPATELPGPLPLACGGVPQRALK